MDIKLNIPTQAITEWDQFFVRETHKQLKLTGYWYKSYVILMIINAILNILESTYYVQISNGSLTAIKIYMVLKLLSCIIGHISSYILMKMTLIVSLNFKTHAYLTFDSLEFGCKQQVPVHTFDDKLNEASSSVVTMIDWGLNSSISVIITILTCMWVFYKQGILHYMFAVSCLFYLFYRVTIKQKQAEFTVFKKESKVVRTRSRELIMLWLPSLQQNDFDVKKIIEKSDIITYELSKIRKTWNVISCLIEIPGQISIIVLWMLTNTTAQFIVMIYVLNQLNSAIHQMTSFQNNYQRFVTDYDSFRDYWDKKYIAEPVKKYPMPETWTIRNVNVVRKKFTLTYVKSSINRLISKNADHNNEQICISKGLTITNGDKILITGRSAGGKTTFVQSLIGHIGGLELEYGVPCNFAHHFTCCYQFIRDKLPTSKISLSDIFPECSTEDIQKYLDVCEIPDIIEKLEGIDKPINDALSGGEKQRLAIAMCIARVENRRIFIIDEPEQGSDREIAIQMLSNINKYMHNKTMFIVSHLSPSELEQTGICFKYHLRIDNGVMKIV